MILLKLNPIGVTIVSVKNGLICASVYLNWFLNSIVISSDFVNSLLTKNAVTEYYTWVPAKIDWSNRPSNGWIKKYPPSNLGTKAVEEEVQNMSVWPNCGIMVYYIPHSTAMLLPGSINAWSWPNGSGTQ